MMDKDNSKTLTRQEIKQGLLGCNIPLSEKALNNLVEKLDEDGDGEIDYGELIAGKQAHRRKINKTILMSREQKMDMEETEVGRVRKKLKRLMDKRDEVLRPKSAMTILNTTTTISGVTTTSNGTNGAASAGAVNSNGSASPNAAAGGSIDAKTGTDAVDAAAALSAMPLPTEVNLNPLLINNKVRGSLLKDLLS